MNSFQRQYNNRLRLWAWLVVFVTLYICTVACVQQESNERKSLSAPFTRAVAERAVDGDTIETTNGVDIRIVGIDTAERGQCGYKKAKEDMEKLVAGKEIRLVQTGKTDHDRYGRLLRYVEVGRVDVGLRQINNGLAIARYDSRDGYGSHPREARYIKADARTPSKRICLDKEK